ncbi:MAG TPA: hypothetical protein IGS17_09745 [Oscillatoriales cyanobacterium M59_W2019_021]|nr:MAG: hypothetical protein D6728_17900 [Cyanobacteria bacterium J055]HIK31486.1 hypothetical protein [Oscillatoriales cyanobacterium M4454_W2019_049]HIK51190.1 hypothetical protein [Oscillatoriales cyanobacterium M59_W2019_021]
MRLTETTNSTDVENEDRERDTVDRKTKPLPQRRSTSTDRGIDSSVGVIKEYVREENDQKMS